MSKESGKPWGCIIAEHLVARNIAAVCNQQMGMLSIGVQIGWTALCHIWNSTSPGIIVFSVLSWFLSSCTNKHLRLLACPFFWNNDISSYIANKVHACNWTHSLCCSCSIVIFS